MLPVQPIHRHPAEHRAEKAAAEGAPEEDRRIDPEIVKFPVEQDLAGCKQDEPPEEPAKQTNEDAALSRPLPSRSLRWILRLFWRKGPNRQPRPDSRTDGRPKQDEPKEEQRQHKK